MRVPAFLFFAALAVPLMCSGAGGSAADGAPPREDTTYFPSWSADGEFLAYSSNRTGDWEIYRLRVKDSSEERLTFDAGTDLGVSWHPRGSRLAFWSNRSGKGQLYELDVQSRTARQVASSESNDRWPAWSPDGRELAFVSDRAGQNDVFVMTVADRSVRRVTRSVEGVFRPQWSPDGTRLIFSARAAGNQEIFSVDLRDQSIRNESSTPDAHEGNPAYAPDGRFIAFDAHAEGREESGDGKWEIWLMAVGSTERRRLTSNDVDDWCPTWHPQGARIAYLSGIGNANYQVRVFDVNSLQMR